MVKTEFFNGVEDKEIIPLNVKMSDIILKSQMNTVMKGHSLGHVDWRSSKMVGGGLDKIAL